MAKFPVKIFVILAIDIFLILISGISINRISEKGTIFCDFKSDSLIVSSLDENSPPELKVGDRLISLNHIKLNNSIEFEFICDGFKKGEKIPVTIERHNVGIQNFESQEYEITLKPYYDTFYIIVVIAVALLYLLLGVYVLLKKKNEIFANIFHWLSIFIALDIILTWGSYTQHPGTFDIIIRSLFSSAKLMHSVLFLHFSITFPNKKWKNGNKIIIPFYILAILGSLWMGFLNYKIFSYPTFKLVNFLTFKLSNSIEWFRFFDLFHDGINRYFFLFCFLCAIINFIHSYFHLSEESERRQLRWIFLGISIPPLIYITLYMLPYLLGYKTIISESQLIMALSIPGITLMIAIIKYRIMDIDLIISRGTLYTGVAGSLSGLYAGIVYLVTWLLKDVTAKEAGVPSAVAAVFVALFFQPAKNKLQTFIDKYFFVIKYNFRIAQQNFSAKIKNSYTVNHIADTVIKTVNEIIPVEKIAFLAYDLIKNELHIVGIQNFESLLSDSDLTKIRIKSYLNTMHLPIALQNSVEESANIQKSNEDIFNRKGISIIFNSFSEDEHLINVLILGRKLSQNRFSLEDIDLLQLITNQSGEIIQKINLQKELTLKEEEAVRLRELNRLNDEKNRLLKIIQNELRNAGEYLISLIPKPYKSEQIETDWIFIPTEDLGGDSFGYNWIDNENFAIYFLDVSGHGVGASLHSVQVLNSLHHKSLPNIDFTNPNEVLNSLNNIFQMHAHNEMYFTLWYGVYNIISGKLKYSSAGHPPAIVISSDKKVCILENQNTFIGATTDINFKYDELAINQPSVLYLYSDGAYEVLKLNGQLYSIEEFHNELLNKIEIESDNLISMYEFTRTFSGKNILDDDYTILKVKFEKQLI